MIQAGRGGEERVRVLKDKAVPAGCMENAEGVTVSFSISSVPPSLDSV